MIEENDLIIGQHYVRHWRRRYFSVGFGGETMQLIKINPNYSWGKYEFLVIACPKGILGTEKDSGSDIRFFHDHEPNRLIPLEEVTIPLSWYPFLHRLWRTFWVIPFSAVSRIGLRFFFFLDSLKDL